MASVPLFHAASRLGRPQLKRHGAVIAAGSLLSFALIGFAPVDDAGSPTGWAANLGGTIALAVLVVATILQVGLKKEVYETPAAPCPPDGNDGAKAAAEESRRLRRQARELAEADPAMALELGIGLPGLTHTYDDGGLVDVNIATADQLVTMCALPRDVAEGVVASRTTIGRYESVDDVIVSGRPR